jgi:hypothetical protein
MVQHQNIYRWVRIPRLAHLISTAHAHPSNSDLYQQALDLALDLLNNDVQSYWNTLLSESHVCIVDDDGEPDEVPQFVYFSIKAFAIYINYWDTQLVLCAHVLFLLFSASQHHKTLPQLSSPLFNRPTLEASQRWAADCIVSSTACACTATTPMRYNMLRIATHLLMTFSYFHLLELRCMEQGDEEEGAKQAARLKLKSFDVLCEIYAHWVPGTQPSWDIMEQNAKSVLLWRAPGREYAYGDGHLRNAPKAGGGEEVEADRTTQ